MVVVSAGRDRFAISTRHAAGKSLFETGLLDEWRTIEVALDALRGLGLRSRAAEGLFVDIGAGIGTRTVRAVRDHGFRGAVAFESGEETSELLAINVILNDLEDEVQHLRTTDSDAPTLDDLVTSADLSPEDLGIIWMDVGGREGHLLSGAEWTLSAGVPCVLRFSADRVGAAGGLEQLELHVQRQYDWFVDLHSVAKSPAEGPLRGVEHFSELPRVYRSGTTDVLLVSSQWHEPVR